MKNSNYIKQIDRSFPDYSKNEILTLRQIIVFIITFALFISAGAAVIIAKFNPAFLEKNYSLFFYRIFAAIMISVTSRIGISLAEIIIILFSAAAVAFTVYAVYKIIKSRRKYCESLKFLVIIAEAVFLISFLFVFSGGLNYYRNGFTEYLGFEVENHTKEDLYALCVALSDKVNETRKEVTENEKRTAALSEADRKNLSVTANEAYINLINSHSGYRDILYLSSKAKVKPVFFSEAMSYLQIVGVFFPYTMEANINVHTSDTDIPSAACHE